MVGSKLEFGNFSELSPRSTLNRSDSDRGTDQIGDTVSYGTLRYAFILGETLQQVLFVSLWR